MDKKRLHVALVGGRTILRAGLRSMRPWSIASSSAALVYVRTLCTMLFEKRPGQSLHEDINLELVQLRKLALADHR